MSHQLQPLRRVFVVDAVRSAVGKKNGALSRVRGDEALAEVMRALLERAGVEPEEVEDLQVGCATQVGEQGWNVARQAALLAGWPETVAGATVDRQCGSSMQAVFSLATAMMAHQLDLAVAGGVEMMSRVPMGSSGGDPSQKLLERYQLVPQGVSAEIIAREWGISRREMDVYSLESHRRAAYAQDQGWFSEIVPVTLPDGSVFTTDEAIRRDSTMERMAALRPAFVDDGEVTAGNSSQIVDGVSACLLASEDAVERLGLRPRARVLSFGLAGVDPIRMLHGNPAAAEKALWRAGLGWPDIAVVEANEAFASVVVQFMRDAGLEERWPDVNPLGGGISLGHPLGATGVRLLATLIPELERREARYGLATMCVALGQAIACVVERV